MQNKTRRLWGLLFALIILMVSVFCISATAAETVVTDGAAAPEITVGETTYVLSDSESAQE